MHACIIFYAVIFTLLGVAAVDSIAAALAKSIFPVQVASAEGRKGQWKGGLWVGSTEEERGKDGGRGGGKGEKRGEEKKERKEGGRRGGEGKGEERRKGRGREAGCRRSTY